MRYELFLRSERPLSEASLAAVARVAAEDGLAVEPYRDEVGVRGVDLGAEMHNALAARALPRRAVELAEAHHLTLFDPQLGRIITEADLPLVRERMTGTQAFVEAALVPDAVTPARGMGPAATLALAGAAVVVMVTLLGRLAGCLS